LGRQTKEVTTIGPLQTGLLQFTEFSEATSITIGYTMHRPNCADTKHRGGRKQCNSGRFMASAGGVPTGSRADFGHCQGSPSRNRSPL